MKTSCRLQERIPVIGRGALRIAALFVAIALLQVSEGSSNGQDYISMTPETPRYIVWSFGPGSRTKTLQANVAGVALLRNPTYQWYHKSLSSSPVYENGKTFTLTARGTQDAGIYFCRVKGQVYENGRFKDHEIILSRHVTVYADVQDAVCGELPWFMDARIKQTGHCSKNSTGRIQVSEGERLAINCTARALHDGVNGNAYLIRTPSGTTQATASLVVGAVKMSHSGTYVCRAANGVSIIYAYIDVIVSKAALPTTPASLSQSTPVHIPSMGVLTSPGEKTLKTSSTSSPSTDHPQPKTTTNERGSSEPNDSAQVFSLYIIVSGAVFAVIVVSVILSAIAISRRTPQTNIQINKGDPECGRAHSATHIASQQPTVVASTQVEHTIATCHSATHVAHQQPATVAASAPPVDSATLPACQSVVVMTQGDTTGTCV
eukprot:scpid47855/ scgid4816/ 